MDVYLDNAATTKIDKKALECISETYNSCYGNPSSIHKMGYDSEKIFKKNLELIGKPINAKARNILITSGGTESNNTALWQIKKLKNKKVLTSRLEHPSILKYCEFLKNTEKVNCEFYRVNPLGKIDLEDLKEKISKNVGMITLPYVNSEVGLIQDIKRIADFIKNVNKNILIHVDGVQAFGKIKTNVDELNIDFMSFSSHKIHGPKGIGGLYIKRPEKFIPLMYGGGQQNKLRSGTEDIPSTAAFGKACQIAHEILDDEFHRITSINKKYRDLLKNNIKDIRFNSEVENSSPYILNLSIKDIKSEVLIHFLEMDEIYISAGTACSSNSKDISPAYEELKIDKDYIEGTVRISFGRFCSMDDAELVVEKMSKYTKDIRKMVRS